MREVHHVQLACPPGSEPVLSGFYGGVLGMTEVRKPPALAARGGWFRTMAGATKSSTGACTCRRRRAMCGIAHYWIVDIRDVRHPALRMLRLEDGGYLEENFSGHERVSLAEPVPIELSANELLD
jgi:hypothetical protein